MPSPADYRKTAYTHRRGTRADQPLATDVLDGTLYYVTDELKTERSNATIWEDITDAGGGGVINNYYNNQYLLGLDGYDGIDGFDAFPGRTGDAGIAGAAGVAGINGQNGIDGLDGVDGLDGLPGTQGPQGPAGSNGTIGVNGAPGPPGLDAEEHEFPYVIPGPQGPIGATGPAGGGGAATYTAFVQDLGSGYRSGTFDLTGLAGLTIGKAVLIVQTAVAIASKGDATDEFEMNAIILTGIVLTAASIRVYWFCSANEIVVGEYA